MSYIIFLTVGLGFIWLGLKTREEVYRLTAAAVGAVLLVCGLIATPLPFQIFVEILTVIALFRVCLRCLEEN
ncbi:MAG: hypothetical protein WA865_22150 [Spirulinaceae cyanobacterium]